MNSCKEGDRKIKIASNALFRERGLGRDSGLGFADPARAAQPHPC